MLRSKLLEEGLAVTRERYLEEGKERKDPAEERALVVCGVEDGAKYGFADKIITSTHF